MGKKEPIYIRLGEYGGDYKQCKEDRPCTVCGKELQYGQLYLAEPQGPRHLGCRTPGRSAHRHTTKDHVA
jgi:hypothetical protein